MYTRKHFSDLLIGDVFEYQGYQLVKLADNINSEEPLHKQYPNCLNLENNHYTVMGSNFLCTIKKSLKDYGPDTKIDNDFYDVEK